MSADPKWYDDSDVLISGAITLAEQPGTPGTDSIVQLINDKDGSVADDLVNARITGLFRDAGAAQYVKEGHEWADRHYLEIRIAAGGWNNTLTLGSYVKLGSNRSLLLPSIIKDQGIKFDVRINAPADALEDDVEVSLRVEFSTATEIGDGATESRHGGIYSGVGDSDVLLIVAASDTVQDPGGPDRDVQVQDLRWISAGAVYAKEQHLITIPNAATDKERYDLLSAAADGTTVTKTAGSEVTGPLVESDKPAIPTGDIALCYVTALDSGAQVNVLDADIENVWEHSFYGFASSGLVATIGRGPAAISDNSLLTNQQLQLVTLTASETNRIWLLRTGGLQATITAVAPSARAELLWEAVTDGSSVTSTVDRRRFIGTRYDYMRFDWIGDLAVSGSERYALFSSQQDGWIDPVNGVSATIGVLGGGETADSVDFEVKVEISGTLTTIFPAGFPGPGIEWDDTAPFESVVNPGKFLIPAGAKVEASITGVTATDVPVGASLIIRIAV